ncbi:hypothetical protein S245_041074, partial [Arachis hypogaea]
LKSHQSSRGSAEREIMIFVDAERAYHRNALVILEKLYTEVQIFYRIRNCLSQLYTKDITPDDKQEFDKALQQE